MFFQLLFIDINICGNTFSLYTNVRNTSVTEYRWVVCVPEKWWHQNATTDEGEQETLVPPKFFIKEFKKSSVYTYFPLQERLRSRVIRTSVTNDMYGEKKLFYSVYQYHLLLLSLFLLWNIMYKNLRNEKIRELWWHSIYNVWVNK